MTNSVLIVRLSSGKLEAMPAIHRYIRSLVGHNYAVELLTWDREGLDQQSVQAECNVVRFRTFSCPPGSKRIYLATFLWQVWLFWRVLTSRAGVVHVCDTISALGPCIAARMRGKRYIYDIRDPLAASFRWSRVMKGLADMLERVIAWGSHVVIVPGENRLPFVPDRAKREGRVIILHNSPADRPDLLTGHQSNLVRLHPSALRLNLCGFLHPIRGIYAVLELARRCDKVQIDIVGRPRNEEMRQEIVRTDRVTFHGQVSMDESHKVMSESDIVLVLYDPSLEVNRAACPNKLFEAMMLGKLIIMNAGIQYAEIVQAEGIGFVVEYGDVSQMQAVVEEIYRNPHVIAECGKRARDLYDRRFSWDSQLPRYFAAIEGRTNGRGAAEVSA